MLVAWMEQKLVVKWVTRLVVRMVDCLVAQLDKLKVVATVAQSA